MKLKDFEYVDAIARCKTFSRAAEELYISQPALTQAIQRLEQELKLPIFTRNYNCIDLTLAGEIFLEEAREVLKITDRLKQRLSYVENIENKTFYLGVSQFYGTYTMPEIMHYISDHYPGIKINLIEDVSTNLEVLLENNKLDFALMPFPITANSLKYQVLLEEEILLGAHSSRTMPMLETYSSDSSLPHVDLSSVKGPYILLKNGLKFRNMTDQILKDAGVEPDIFFETMNLSTVESFIRQDLGIGFLPSSVPKDPEISYYRFSGKYSSRKYVIAYKEDNYQAKSSLEIVNIIKKALTEKMALDKAVGK